MQQKSSSPFAAKTAQDLEWPLLVEQLAAECRSRAAAERARELMPADSLSEAHERVSRLDDAVRLSIEGTELPIRTVDDLRPALDRIARGATATGTELRSVGTALDLGRSLRRFGAVHAERCGALARLLGSDPALDSLCDALVAAIDADGTVNDQASPELARARGRVREAKRELLARLGELIARYQDVLRDRYWAERDGRHVLPVRADAHFRVRGIVLGSSSSGGTLYVEPEEITPLGNRLSVYVADAEREEMRVLTALSERVRAQGEGVARSFEICLQADLLAATVRWTAAHRAAVVFPTEEPRIALRDMRHPLLIGRLAEVVPNDLELGAGSALVISGPNAGGKTVALKCLGLAAWMVRSGLPLPAHADSSVGWFDPVLTDVGDEQSLERSLSTFSAHVTNLSFMLGIAGRHALILLDEVVAGTDPEEGAALATAWLEAAVEQGAAVAVTTHYERLKERAYEDARFVNASVGFDLGTMAPTFRVALGVPGPSSALAVAARFGIPRAVLARAQALVPDASVAREDLVQQLAAEKEALGRVRAELEEQAALQATLTRELEVERQTVRSKEREKLAREAQVLMAAVREARAELRSATERLRKPDLRREDLREVGRSIGRAAAPVTLGSELLKSARPHPTISGANQADLKQGARAYLPRLATVVEVMAPPSRGQVRVSAGAMKLLVSLDELEPVNVPRPPAVAQRRALPRPSATVSAFVPVRTRSNTLDLRGQRMEEALEAVDAFLDRLTREEERAGFVLHGHGTGRLKTAVREHLGRSRYVERSGPAEPDDGGDAFTLFWLKS
jgi:DNA mismatch repair protein MutS2